MARITLITATFNRAAMLGDALESVRTQNFADLEHLIIDGASTDSTKDVIARFAHVRFVSEPDRGLYDAWNKGLRLGTGEIIGFLNSDDIQHPGTLQAVSDAFEDPAVLVVTGGAEFASPSEGSERVRKVTNPDALKLSPSNVTAGWGLINARFFRRSLIQSTGEFDLQYRLAADREWMLRSALLSPKERIIEHLCYRYQQHSESMTLDPSGRNAGRYRQEHLRIAESYLKKTDLSSEARVILRKWHQRESVCEAQQALLRGEWGSVWTNSIRGWRENPSWPVAYFMDGCRGLAQRAGILKSP